MKHLKLFLILLLTITPLRADILSVGIDGDGYDYSSVSQAARNANPGDTIYVFPAVYPGGEYIENLNGEPDKPISIISFQEKAAVFEGSATGWHLINCSHLIISGFVFRRQTGNGVNIDDGGDFTTPAHHIIIENCEWQSMNATGNNDELKLSGLDSFQVRKCIFRDGSQGGSLVDMVGCHFGIFDQNSFENGGSNSIQAKGGSSNIIIRRNGFLNGGQRAINIGGMTGAVYFRPLDAPFESSEILVYANIFYGGTAPIAFASTIHSVVANNTIVYPQKWVFRILQDNTEAGIATCSYNMFFNNIIYLGNQAVTPVVNIGPDTRPETFTFANNLWYNYQSPAWNNANLPADETNPIYGEDPLFDDVDNYNVDIDCQSPAANSGRSLSQHWTDFYGRPFNMETPSIGAIEGCETSEVSEKGIQKDKMPGIYPNPCGNQFYLSLGKDCRNILNVNIYNNMGRSVKTINFNNELKARSIIKIETAEIPPGFYFVEADFGSEKTTSLLIIIK